MYRKFLCVFLFLLLVSPACAGEDETRGVSTSWNDSLNNMVSDIIFDIGIHDRETYFTIMRSAFAGNSPSCFMIAGTDAEGVTDYSTNITIRDKDKRLIFDDFFVGYFKHDHSDVIKVQRAESRNTSKHRGMKAGKPDSSFAALAVADGGHGVGAAPGGGSKNSQPPNIIYNVILDIGMQNRAAYRLIMSNLFHENPPAVEVAAETGADGAVEYSAKIVIRGKGGKSVFERTFTGYFKSDYSDVVKVHMERKPYVTKERYMKAKMRRQSAQMKK